MSERAEGVSARADLIGGIAWIVFGAAIIATSLAMDRLEQFGATLYTAPGLVPGALGATIVVLGIVLAVRSIRRGALAVAARSTSERVPGLARVGIAAALALVYTLVLIGRAPFPIATTLFVFAFIGWFGVREGESIQRRLVVAAITAIATAAVVTLVFERVFLVRLP